MGLERRNLELLLLDQSAARDQNAAMQSELEVAREQLRKAGEKEREHELCRAASAAELSHQQAKW